MTLLGRCHLRSSAPLICLDPSRGSGLGTGDAQDWAGYGNGTWDLEMLC